MEKPQKQKTKGKKKDRKSKEQTTLELESTEKAPSEETRNVIETTIQISQVTQRPLLRSYASIVGRDHDGNILPTEQNEGIVQEETVQIEEAPASPEPETYIPVEKQQRQKSKSKKKPKSESETITIGLESFEQEDATTGIAVQALSLIHI